MSPSRRDAGFTLVELLATIALLGLIMSFAVAGFRHYSSAREEVGTARSLQSALRQAQQRAVTEGRAMCVKFASGSWTVWRTACDSAAGTKLEGPTVTESATVHLAVDGNQTLTFTPRGTATWDSAAAGGAPDCGTVASFRVLVTRDGSGRTYRLCVAALTGRVDLHG